MNNIFFFVLRNYLRDTIYTLPKKVHRKNKRNLKTKKVMPFVFKFKPSKKKLFSF